MNKGEFSLSGRTIGVLAKRDLISTLHGWGIYIATFISFLASSFILKNYLDSIRENNISISSDPLNYPLFISVVIVSFYLAILSAISISREKEQGTLEVLFYGPVSSPSFILAKYIKNMLTYLIMVGLFFVYFSGVSGLTNLGISYGLIEAILFSIFFASCMISFGLLISSLTERVRSSILWLVGIFLAFLAIQISYTILLGIPEESMSSPLIYLGNTLSVISKGIGWISPFSYLTRGMDAISLGNLRIYGLNIVYCVIYSLILLILSVIIFEKKGVRG
ncbi:hypothetical protein DRZ78_04095 [Candidatus Aerophobetes bacterium]|uniref:ABC transporter permease n=1 Tax=Aerophobetes bacterium TaxID=2030807 RepID=A0A662CYF2_UNCAE|nr:MAG: hypothetical protein DRZ78_04095 [Candidatus Aerophobetes bacterium]